MMLDTSAQYGQSLGQQLQPYGQPFGQQSFGQSYGQPFGQQSLGQPYGQPFGQQSLGQPYGQPFGLPPQFASGALGHFAPGAGPAPSGIPLPLVAQLLCAQLGPLAAALHLGIPPLGLLPLGVGQPGAFGGLASGGWPAPFGGQLGAALVPPQSYPIAQAIWGWPGSSPFASGIGGGPSAFALQALLGHVGLGSPGNVFGPRAIGAGMGGPAAYFG